MKPPKKPLPAAPASARDSSNRVFYLILASLAAFFLISVGFAVYAFQKVMGGVAPLSFAKSNEIVLLPLEGPLYASDDIVLRLKEFRRGSAKALLLRINSPGGGVAASQEIHREVLRVREEGGKVVVASIAGLGASGAYYVAAAADRIVASPGSVTGSIGVLAEFPDASGLLGKVGVRFQTVKSGKFKNTGALDRPLTPEERDYLQGMIDDVHEQFLEDVLESRGDRFRAVLAEVRGMAPEKIEDAAVRAHVAAYADGRILTGRQARELGFVDALGNYLDAVRITADLAGIEGEPEVRLDRPIRVDRLFSSLLPWRPEGKLPGFRLDYRMF